jgi:divalent metal cation (Fe/Co/Zn/Cd) transporter
MAARNQSPAVTAGHGRFHALRTRQAGRRSFASFHVLTPGSWTVQDAHDPAERVEADLGVWLANIADFTHLDPSEDPAAFEDIGLARRSLD